MVESEPGNNSNVSGEGVVNPLILTIEIKIISVAITITTDITIQNQYKNKLI
ncbi:MAG: hypothetical protein V4620_12775 [Bacteroidota bacterium]